jgi:hypothetical protein
MTGFDENDFELIFDPLAKSAIIRRGDSLVWLPGPFRDYPDAMLAARARLRQTNVQYPGRS